MRDRRVVYKSFRVPESVIETARLVAGCDGKTISEVLRDLLVRYTNERLPYAKTRIKEALDILSRVEKAPADDFLTKAKVAAALYPVEGARIDYYVEIERKLAAVNQLVEKGFERSFAEELVARFFDEAEGPRFRKSLEQLAAGAVEQWARDEARRAISKRRGEEI
jgi:2-polyprenyl-6-methoxyphenol hydroxylase-like FAD-dependent oxidoreductase